MDRGAWWAAVHGVVKSRTRLSDFTFTFHFHTLEKEMATHSSVLAWRIPGMGEPCGLSSMGSHRVGHDWSDLAAAVKGMIFLVVIYGCESWTIKKAESWRTDAFELWYWRTHLRVPWTARWSSQSILKQTSPEYSLEGLMLKLKLQYFGHLIWRTNSLQKSLKVGKIEGRWEWDHRGWDGWMASPTRWTWVWVSSRSLSWTGKTGVLPSMVSQRVVHDSMTEWNWTALNHYFCDLLPLLKLSCSSTYLSEFLVLCFGAPNISVPILTILSSNIFIISSIIHIWSTEGRSKAFNTCSSHISAVAIFYESLTFMYLHASSVSSMD